MSRLKPRPTKTVHQAISNAEVQRKLLRRFERRRLRCRLREIDRLRREPKCFAPARALLGLRPRYLAARENRFLGTPQEFRSQESAADCRASDATAARRTCPWIRNLLA